MFGKKSRPPAGPVIASMARIAAILALASLGALGAGCSSTDAPTMASELRKVNPARKAGPWRLAMAPVEVRLSAALGPTITASSEEYWAPVPVDAAAIRAAATLAATDANAFLSIAFDEALAIHERAPSSGDQAAKEAGRGGAGGDGAKSGSAAPSAAPKQPLPMAVPATLTARLAFPVAVPPAEGSVVDAYFPTAADLLLSLRVTRHSVRYVERTGAYPWSLVFLYALWIWPAWLVADERYAADIEIEAELRAVAADRAIWTKTYRAKPMLDLDTYDRGWMLTGQISVPGWLEAENYRAAGKLLLPHALNEIASGLKKDLAAATLTRDEQVAQGIVSADAGDGPRGPTPTATGVTLTSSGDFANVMGAPRGSTLTAKAAPTPPPNRDMIEAGLPATFAVCVGVSKLEETSFPAPPRFASEEAEALGAILTDRRRGGVPARAVSVLVDLRNKSGRTSQRNTILYDLKRFAARASERDTIVLTFAGLGFAAADDLMLVPRVWKSYDPVGMALSLGEIGRALGATKARQVLILDVSFDGEAQDGALSRTVPRASLAKVPGLPAPDGGARVGALLEAFASKAPRRVIVTSGAPGEAVLDISPIPEDQKGIFAARLRDALTSAATDVNRDGAVDLLEAFEAARGETMRISQTSGSPETPTLYPKAGAEESTRAVVLSRIPAAPR